eukprot:TRINITY_DN2919_c7_g1_i1.p1 TRINITY_DN2919_c7_g1~~TRINITY_DN2919_c7_g1_i1.p1  ORF type:complete len:286 (-),score=97.23 TRINITY_DN2919_c7_g1_i1:138-995(-)
MSFNDYDDDWLDYDDNNNDKILTNNFLEKSLGKIGMAEGLDNGKQEGLQKGFEDGIKESIKLNISISSLYFSIMRTDELLKKKKNIDDDKNEDLDLLKKKISMFYERFKDEYLNVYYKSTDEYKAYIESIENYADVDNDSSCENDSDSGCCGNDSDGSCSKDGGKKSSKNCCNDENCDDEKIENSCVSNEDNDSGNNNNSDCCKNDESKSCACMRSNGVNNDENKSCVQKKKKKKDERLNNDQFKQLLNEYKTEYDNILVNIFSDNNVLLPLVINEKELLKINQS